MSKVTKNSSITLKCKVIWKIRGHRKVKCHPDCEICLLKGQRSPQNSKGGRPTKCKRSSQKVKGHLETSMFTQGVKYSPLGSKIPGRSKVISKFKHHWKVRGLLLSAFLKTHPRSEMGREWSDFGATDPWTSALCEGKQWCKGGVYALRCNYTINCN